MEIASLKHFVQMQRQRLRGAWQPAVHPGFSTRAPFIIESLEARVLLSAAPLPADLPVEVIAVEFEPSLTAKIGTEMDLPDFLGSGILFSRGDPVVNVSMESLNDLVAGMIAIESAVVEDFRGMVLDSEVNYTMADIMDASGIGMSEFFGFGTALDSYLMENGLKDSEGNTPPSALLNAFELQSYLIENWSRQLAEGEAFLGLAENASSYFLEFKIEVDRTYLMSLDAKVNTDSMDPLEMEVGLKGGMAYRLEFVKGTGEVRFLNDGFYFEIEWDQEHLADYIYAQKLADRFEQADIDAWMEVQRNRAGKIDGSFASFVRTNPFARVPGWATNRVASYPGFADLIFVQGEGIEYPALEGVILQSIDSEPPPDNASFVPPLYAYSIGFVNSARDAEQANHKKELEEWWRKWLEYNREGGYNL